MVVERVDLQLNVHSAQKQPQIFFIWPKSTVQYTVKLELREQGTNLYGDVGEFDGHCGINLEIWNQWLYLGTNDIARLVSDSGIHSYWDSCNKIG